MNRRKLIHSQTIKLSKSASQLVEEYGISKQALRKIKGTGKGGKLTQRDINIYIRESGIDKA